MDMCIRGLSLGDIAAETSHITGMNLMRVKRWFYRKKSLRPLLQDCMLLWGRPLLCWLLLWGCLLLHAAKRTHARYSPCYMTRCPSRCRIHAPLSLPQATSQITPAAQTPPQWPVPRSHQRGWLADQGQLNAIPDVSNMEAPPQ